MDLEVRFGLTLNDEIYDFVQETGTHTNSKFMFYRTPRLEAVVPRGGPAMYNSSTGNALRLTGEPYGENKVRITGGRRFGWNMSGGMCQRMPERMPEHMSKRMPKCIHSSTAVYCWCFNVM